MKIAIIPARGGSKRIPRKNIKNFCGKPMIAWSIEAARHSNLFDSILVSTDDREIAEVALEYGAEAPFVRPPELADDYVGTGPVVKHALEWALQNKSDDIRFACTIYATAPFLQPCDLINGFELLLKSQSEMCFSVTSFPFPIQRALKMTQSGGVAMFQPDNFSTRSQDLEPAFHDAGQFYWAKSSAIIQELSAFSNHAIPYRLPRHRVQDIDTGEDWERAELMFKACSTFS